MAPMHPQAISVPAAAQAVGICRSKLYPYITSGELPSIKIGARRLIRVDALREWLASKEARGT